MLKKVVVVIVLAALSILICTAIVRAANVHSGYTSTTDFCEQCHDLHNAAAGYSLLKYGSVVSKTAVCDACHMPGGLGTATSTRQPYYVVPTASVAAQHRPTFTIAPNTGIPTLGIATSTYWDGSQPLCFACHSPHDGETVLPFLGDSTTTVSSRLLRKTGAGTGLLPGAGTKSVSWYGGDWCADCHGLNAGMGGTVHQSTTSGLSWATASLARSNGAYAMSPVNTAVPRKWPICQQCHEDARSVWDHTLGVASAFNYGVNPVYGAFPHEGNKKNFRLEPSDDLCLNCHQTEEMP